MREIKKGDIVSRCSYSHDIIFLVKRIIKLANKKQIAILKGIDVRVEADAPIEDLKIVGKEEQKAREKELEQRIIYKIEKERFIFLIEYMQINNTCYPFTYIFKILFKMRIN